MPRAGTELTDPPTTGRALLWDLLTGGGTLWCATSFGPGEQRYHTARIVAAAWLLDERPPTPAERPDLWWLPADAMSAYEALRALPADEQRARVAKLRAAELSCAKGDRLDMLVGSP